MNRRDFLKAGCATAFTAAAGIANASTPAPQGGTPVGRVLPGMISVAGPASEAASAAPALPLSWAHYARIAGYGLRLDRVDEIVKDATASHVFGIETDNDITGRYESFVDPTEKLKAIEAVARRAHQAGNYAFVYISGLECITAHADKTKHSFFKDHPDWVQRDVTGKPAIFSYGIAFWVAPGDEDAWISPYAPGWRKIYMERVRQIAAAGIDGIYVDIPYWMTHYTGWEKTWASFDDYTVAAFKKATGLDAKKDVKLGDYNDPGFIRWIDFRIQSITNFMREINVNVKSVKPSCLTIAEIWPGIESDVPRVGADPYELYPVLDLICHEYDFGSGDHMSAGRTPLQWIDYEAGYLSFRAFAQGKPTWILNYSWDGEKRVDPGKAMQNLAMAELAAGCNMYDARGHVMSGSNNIQMRKEIYAWISQHQQVFYSSREPGNPIGVYFSPRTRDYFPEQFIESYRAFVCLLLQSHLEFQIVTPRTLKQFAGKSLILANVKCLSNGELLDLESYVKSGRWLMATGETGKYSQERVIRGHNPVHHLLRIANARQRQVSRSPLHFFYDPEYPGIAYSESLKKDFNACAADGNLKNAAFEKLRRQLVADILQNSGHEPCASIKASPFVTTQNTQVNGKLHIFFANFKGLKSKQNATQLSEKNVKITIPAHPGSTAHSLAFGGSLHEIRGERSGSKFTFTIPEIDKGAVVWFS